jgi:hypothetical protein
MASLRGNKHTAVALFVDGLELKMAKLSLRKNNVVLEELQSVMLASKLEERHVGEYSAEVMGDSVDTFALPAGESGAEPSSDNNSVFLGVLSKYPSADYLLAYAISEPSIYYHTLESDFGLKGAKLKNRILDELRNVRSVQPALDAIDYFDSADKNVVCVIREDGMTMMNTLEQIKPFLGKRLPRIPLIEVSDVALMNLARANYGFAPEEITTIIYVGVGYRLIFMKGSEFVHFACAG